MQATPLTLTARTLYAELRELALAVGASEAIGPLPGSLVRKTLKGGDYLYYQYRDLNGRTRQTYLGPDNAQTAALAESLSQRADNREADLARLNELRAAFVGAGGAVMEHAPLRILQAFAQAGTLRPGNGCAVLIGTHAFNALANQLGVRWPAMMQTQDIDLTGETDIDLAVPVPDTPAPDVLAQLDMGFLPVPSLDAREPSTSFRIRGQEMRVDLLAPLVGKPEKGSVFVPALNARAQPLRFLDYLLEEVVPVVIVGRKAQVLVNVPAPARFALHKLLVSESRGAAFATKAEKDRQQAVQMLEVLLEEMPDEVEQAREDLEARGKGWRDKLVRGLKKVGKRAPLVAEWHATYSG